MSASRPDRRPFGRCSALLIGALLALGARAAEVGGSGLHFNAEPITPVPLHLDSDPRLREVGRQLFFDPRLSGDGDSHCGSCHALPPISEAQPASGVSEPMGKHKRSVPLLYNVGEAYWLNWDGRYSDLETLVADAVSDPDKLNADWATVLERLRPVYASRFGLSGSQPLTRAGVVEALAVFLRSLNTPNARLDRFLRGDHDALTLREQQGYRLFKEVGCATCHNGRAAGANFFEQFYIYRHEGGAEGEPRLRDQGRYYVTGESDDANLYRVPTLRNVVHSAPYFHDGSTQTLREAIEEMAEHQLGVVLAEEDVLLLEDFLKTLSGNHPGVTP